MINNRNRPLNTRQLKNIAQSWYKLNLEIRKITINLLNNFRKSEQ